MRALDWAQGMSIPGGIWGLIGITITFFALVGFKHLPGSWHVRYSSRLSICLSVFLCRDRLTVLRSSLLSLVQIRLFRPLVRHYLLSNRRRRPSGPSAIFQPVICSTRTALIECDYNMHKSNSTYFADLDIARSELLCCLLASFLETRRRPSREDQAKGSFGFALGAVSCHFKRAILPYQKYEMWTRILTWDDKWLYLVTHFVQAGRVKPTTYSLQPWKKKTVVPGSKTDNKSSSSSRNSNSNSNKQDDETTPHPAILATSVARYVFKQGRWSIPPDTVLATARLLAAKPPVQEVADSRSAASSSVDDSTAAAAAARTTSPRFVSSSTTTADPTSHLLAPTFDATDWTAIEEERRRGMRLAEMLAGLDGLHGEFTGRKGPALGEY